MGGSLSWAKPKHSGVNKRFLNKTMISTLIQNNIVTRTNTQQKISTSKLLKESPALNKKETEEELKVSGDNEEKKKRRSGKIVISNKSRLNAYLKSKSEKKESETKTEEK